MLFGLWTGQNLRGGLWTGHHGLWTGHLFSSPKALWIYCIYDQLWPIMTSYYELWPVMTSYEHLWPVMTSKDVVEQNWTNYDYWLQAKCDKLWEVMISYDWWWLFMTRYDQLWSIREGLTLPQRGSRFCGWEGDGTEASPLPLEVNDGMTWDTMLL